MNNKKGFTLVELMVVVAIIAILAAVALPMYSTFKQKSKVGVALKSLGGAQTALQGWFENKGTFSEITTVPAAGGALVAGTKRVGAGLPTIENMTWGFASSTASSIELTFAWGPSSGCPAATCDGRWYLICYAENDKCDVAIEVGGTDDPLDLNTGTIP